MSQLSAVATPHRIALSRPGTEAPLLVQRAAPDHRPYLHPVLAPDGAGVVTEDAPAHHPWQHGVYTGLTDVAFGQYAYGGLFLRMPYRAGQGGAARSSEGGDARAADGARARWMAVAMPIDGRPAVRPEAGVAVLSHPPNP